MPGSQRRTWLIVPVLIAGLFAGPAAAQTPPVVTLPELPAKTATVAPGSLGWPGQPPAPAMPLLESPPSAFPTVAPMAAAEPLPGSLVDEYEKGLAARQSFRYCTWKGTTITAMPTSLLWNPPFASLREPRMMLSRSNVSDPDSNYSVETSIGGVMGFFRTDFSGHDVSMQFDIGAVAHTRLTPASLIAADYRFQFPLSFRWGNWHSKISYEHTSTHLGDKFIRFNSGQSIPNWAKDEMVFGLGRYFFEHQLRIYGQVSFAFSQQLPVESKSPYRGDLGFEWVQTPGATGWSGSPFIAMNLDSQGDQKYTPNLNTQAGWLWRNPYERLANFRIFAQYYVGRAPYGQLFFLKEKYYSVGFSCDY